MKQIAFVLRWLADMPARLQRWADKLDPPPVANIGGPDNPPPPPPP